MMLLLLSYVIVSILYIDDILIICSIVAGDKAPKLSGYPLRLVGGASLYEGRVEILYKGVWGTVCHDEWNLINSHVVCRQIGFGPALQYYQGNYNIL